MPDQHNEGRQVTADKLFVRNDTDAVYIEVDERDGPRRTHRFTPDEARFIAGCLTAAALQASPWPVGDDTDDVTECGSCGSPDIYYDPADGWSCNGCGRNDSDG